MEFSVITAARALVDSLGWLSAIGGDDDLTNGGIRRVVRLNKGFAESQPFYVAFIPDAGAYQEGRNQGAYE
ncbi:MAG: hypothetical protein LAQ69_04925 [Acidobacteriia bacterium]|nr:hypothetical protein [Terriglobia bacterium]